MKHDVSGKIVIAVALERNNDIINQLWFHIKRMELVCVCLFVCFLTILVKISVENLIVANEEISNYFVWLSVYLLHILVDFTKLTKWISTRKQAEKGK